MLLKSAGATLCSLALMAATTLSQTPAQPPAAPPQTPTPQTPTFRAAVTLVTTDVITRDNSGRFLADLTKDDFTVLEDGVEQTITSFSLVHGGRTFTSLEPPAPTAQEGHHPADGAAPAGLGLDRPRPPDLCRRSPLRARILAQRAEARSRRSSTRSCTRAISRRWSRAARRRSKSSRPTIASWSRRRCRRFAGPR